MAPRRRHGDRDYAGGPPPDAPPPAASFCPGGGSPVVAMRERYPCWGGRKLEVKLRESGLTDVPRPSTITAILQRHGVLAPRQERPAPATRRFEHLSLIHISEPTRLGMNSY